MRCVRSVVFDNDEDAHCEKEQEELALSLTLLHNKTKMKIRLVREQLNTTNSEVANGDVSEFVGGGYENGHKGIGTCDGGREEEGDGGGKQAVCDATKRVPCADVECDRGDKHGGGDNDGKGVESTKERGGKGGQSVAEAGCVAAEADCCAAACHSEKGTAQSSQ